MKKFRFVFFIFTSIFLLSCVNKKVDTQKIVNIPDKIIFYTHGKIQEISSDNSIFIELVDLTNSRFDTDKISISKDGVDINKFVSDSKQADISIEFIYNEKQKINIKNSQGFNPISYNKLYFIIKSENNFNSEYFQFSDGQNYIDSSRGPIKPPNEIFDLINTL